MNFLIQIVEKKVLEAQENKAIFILQFSIFKMQIKEELIKNIEDVLKKFGIENPNIVLSLPIYLELGDCTTNVAMSEYKKMTQVLGAHTDEMILVDKVSSPLEFAHKIKKELDARKIKHIKKIEVVTPGFINFFFDKNYFSETISSILFEKNFGKNKTNLGHKTIIEYTDPNPFKEFHIGHLMSNSIGESISRILESNGAEIKKACYQGDVGLHVAKAIWDLMNSGVYVVKDVVQSAAAYVAGSNLYEKDPIIKENIDEINKRIYDRSDEKINKLYDSGREKSLEYFETIYKKLGTKFDYFFFESKVGSFGKEIVEKNTPEIFEKSDGAVVFKGEKYDKTLHTRVFINKDGLPTYEAKELGLAKVKHDEYPYDVSIVITGNEINEYFRVLLRAMSLVFPELAQKTKHISHGMLRLPEGKMSSRTGNVITAESLINQVKEKISEKIKNREFMESEKDEISELVAIGAIKYSILRQAIGGDIIFDFDKSISFDGDSGPYLQYATVRANSVLGKARGTLEMSNSLPEDWQTTNLERLLERFPSVVERAGKEHSPHHIVTYLTELASEFNSFYASHKIIDEEDLTSSYRLTITQAFVNIMSSGLYLLGIKIPTQM